MTLRVALDNDLLIKLSGYRLLPSFVDFYGDVIGVLGAARFVVTRRLRTLGLSAEDDALQCWNEFLEHWATQLEPTVEEIALASDLEELALVHELPLDGGESQLAAMAVTRGFGLLVTGDKRAIGALERLLVAIPPLSALTGRIGCLEQAINMLITTLGIEPIRAVVCADAKLDRAVTAIAECGRRDNPDELPGLASYVEHLRTEAPTLLAAGLDLPQ